jgi:hypothetical protein
VARRRRNAEAGDEVAPKAVAFWCCFEHSKLALVGRMKCARLRGQNFEKCGVPQASAATKNQTKPSQVLYISISLHLRSRMLLNGSLFEIQLTPFTFTSGTAE